MQSYLLIAHDVPTSGADCQQVFELAASLAKQREGVMLYLTRGAVSLARIGCGEAWLAPLLSAQVRIFVDPAGLTEHSIPNDNLLAGVVSAPIEQLMDQLTAAPLTQLHVGLTAIVHTTLTVLRSLSAQSATRCRASALAAA